MLGPVIEHRHRGPLGSPGAPLQHRVEAGPKAGCQLVAAALGGAELALCDVELRGNEARKFGVRSAMPMFKALAACPDAVVIKPEMAKYVREGRRIRTMMEALTPLVWEAAPADDILRDLALFRGRTDQ